MLTYQTRFVCGLELDLAIDFTPVYEDTSFDHAFGTEHSGHWGVESIESITVDGNLKKIVRDTLRHNCPNISRKSLLKRSRRWIAQIELAFVDEDWETILDEDKMLEAAGEYQPDEPDAPERDEPEDNWIDLAYEDRYADAC